MHFRRAQPPGCRPAGEHDGGWWCEITSDGGIAVRNVERLREVVRSAEKRAAERDEARESDDVSGEAASRRRELAAGRRPRRRRRRHRKIRRRRRQTHPRRFIFPRRFVLPRASPGRRGSSAARTEPARTSTTCDTSAVTSSARVAPESSSADATTQGSNPTGVDASDESQCDELLAWRAKYEEEDAEGKPEFWRWLSRGIVHFGKSGASTRTRHGRGRHGHGKDSRGDRIQGGQGVQGAESRDAPR